MRKSRYRKLCNFPSNPTEVMSNTARIDPRESQVWIRTQPHGLAASYIQARSPNRSQLLPILTLLLNLVLESKAPLPLSSFVSSHVKWVS